MEKSLLYPTLTLALVLAACSPGRQDDRATGDSAATARAGTGSAGGMHGMRGMEGMGGMMGGKMMEDMHSHMRMMEGASADSIKAMMPMHRQMAANMISEINREMREMNMQGDTTWTATVDSVRQDLVRMPELSGAELKRFMPAHHARMMRLMELHRSMMGRMKP